MLEHGTIAGRIVYWTFRLDNRCHRYLAQRKGLLIFIYTELFLNVINFASKAASGSFFGAFFYQFFGSLLC